MGRNVHIWTLRSIHETGQQEAETHSVNLARVSGDFRGNERPEDIEATEVGWDVQFLRQIRIYKRTRNLCEAHGCYRNDGCGGGGESGNTKMP